MPQFAATSRRTTTSAEPFDPGRGVSPKIGPERDRFTGPSVAV